jgi:hypothetical protein
LCLILTGAGGAFIKKLFKKKVFHVDSNRKERHQGDPRRVPDDVLILAHSVKEVIRTLITPFGLLQLHIGWEKRTGKRSSRQIKKLSYWHFDVHALMARKSLHILMCMKHLP